MKMDTSFWEQTSKNIKFFDTKKQYFGKFLWRLVIHAEAGRCVLGDKSIQENLSVRKTQWPSSFSMGQSWVRRPNFSSIDPGK